MQICGIWEVNAASNYRLEMSA